MRKVFSCFFVFCFFFAISGNALALDVDTKASATLSYYEASLKQGPSSRQIEIIYSVTANTTASTIGISTIKIYKSNGILSATINGTKTNGLLTGGTYTMSDTYNYHGDPGAYYYAVITFTATINGVTDSKQYTTNMVMAPY